MRKLMVSVIGGHNADDNTRLAAVQAGRIIAESGSVLVTGGMGGVMEAASEGAREAGGLTIGIIPGSDRSKANQYVDIVIPTGMGHSRNTLTAGAADMVLAFKGSYGTLSEIAFALIAGTPVYGIDSWDLDGVRKLSSVSDLAEVIAEQKALKSLI